MATGGSFPRLERQALVATIRDEFRARRWPAPTFDSDHMYFVGSTVRLSAFEIDLDRAIAYCYTLMVDAPHRHKYPRQSDTSG